MQAAGTRLRIAAPLGLADLLRPVVHANRARVTAAPYRRKTARRHALWPRLTILPWAESTVAAGAGTCDDGHSNGSTNR